MIARHEHVLALIVDDEVALRVDAVLDPRKESLPHPQRIVAEGGRLDAAGEGEAEEARAIGRAAVGDEDIRRPKEVIGALAAVNLGAARVHVDRIVARAAEHLPGDTAVDGDDVVASSGVDRLVEILLRAIGDENDVVAGAGIDLSALEVEIALLARAARSPEHHHHGFAGRGRRRRGRRSLQDLVGAEDDVILAGARDALGVLEVEATVGVVAGQVWRSVQCLLDLVIYTGVVGTHLADGAGRLGMVDLDRLCAEISNELRVGIAEVGEDARPQC